MSEVWGEPMVGGWGPLQRSPGGRPCWGKGSSPRPQPEHQHNRPTQQPPEASSLYFSLLIGYRVQALTVVKPSEERARVCSEWPPGARPMGEALVGAERTPQPPHPLSPKPKPPWGPRRRKGQREEIDSEAGSAEGSGPGKGTSGSRGWAVQLIWPRKEYEQLGQGRQC